MAEVYLALERNPTGLSRLVVIKRILPALAADPRFVEMFRLEARLSARVQHPHVVQIFETGDIAGFPYLSMEYVPGSTLRQLMEAVRQGGQTIPVNVVVALLVQAASAVHAAHDVVEPGGPARGMVHRDVSPQNLMVTDHGHLKLLDFGIATEGGEALRPGLLEGKVNYMSPEVLRQVPVDRRADLFALGVVGWELLTLKKPFDTGDTDGTLAAIVAGDLAHLRDERPDIPEAVSEVIHRALATDPEARQESAGAFRAELLTVASALGLRCDADVVADVVRTHVGERHAAQKAQIEATLTEGALPALESILVDDDAPADEMLPDLTDEHGVDLVSTVPPAAPRPQPEAAEGRLGGFPVPLAALLGAAIVAVLWSALSRGPAGRPLDVLLAPTLPAVVLAVEMEPIRHYLEGALHRPVRFRVGASYLEVADAVRHGNVPVAILPAGVAESVADAPGVRILAWKEVDGTNTSDGLFVTLRDGGPDAVHGLRGATLCYPDALSRSGWDLPRAWLRSQGIDPDTDVRWHASGNHDQALRDVLAGRCAGAGTWAGNFTSSDQRSIPSGQLRVVANTGTTEHDAIVAGPAADAATAEALAQALIRFDPKRDAHVARVGESEHITGFVPP